MLRFVHHTSDDNIVFMHLRQVLTYRKGDS